MGQRNRRHGRFAFAADGPRPGEMPAALRDPARVRRVDPGTLAPELSEVQATDYCDAFSQLSLVVKRDDRSPYTEKRAVISSINGSALNDRLNFAPPVRD